MYAQDLTSKKHGREKRSDGDTSSQAVQYYTGKQCEASVSM